MSIFTKQFVSADEYEKWLLAVGERINVLSITHPAQSVYKPRQLWIRKPQMPSELPLGSSDRQAGAITVKYQTSDQTLVPAKSKIAILAQVSMIAALFFALFMLAISKL